MSRSLRQLTEAQVKKAIAEGKLDDLEGQGKPLPSHPEEAMVDGADLIGHRIMAEAGAIPEEIRLKKELAKAKEAYRKAKGSEAERPAMARIAELDQKLSVAQEARRKFFKT